MSVGATPRRTSLRRGVAAALLAAGLAAAVVYTQASADGPAAAGCGPAEAKTLARGSQARVYRAPFDNRFRRYQILACLEGAAEPYEVDRPDFEQFAFSRPAVDVAGPLIGYALIQGQEETGGGPAEVVVVVEDLRAPGNPLRLTRAGPHVRAKVGSLKLRTNGAIAWIACPEPDEFPVGYMRPTCAEAGALNTVYRWSAGERRREVLDRGRRISPRSLRLRDGRVHWRNGGRSLSAPLG